MQTKTEKDKSPTLSEDVLKAITSKRCAPTTLYLGNLDSLTVANIVYVLNTDNVPTRIPSLKHLIFKAEEFTRGDIKKMQVAFSQMKNTCNGLIIYKIEFENLQSIKDHPFFNELLPLLISQGKVQTKKIMFPDNVGDAECSILHEFLDNKAAKLRMASITPERERDYEDGSDRDKRDGKRDRSLSPRSRKNLRDQGDSPKRALRQSSSSAAAASVGMLTAAAPAPKAKPNGDKTSVPPANRVSAAATSVATALTAASRIGMHDGEAQPASRVSPPTVASSVRLISAVEMDDGDSIPPSSAATAAVPLASSSSAAAAAAATASPTINSSQKKLSAAAIAAIEAGKAAKARGVPVTTAVLSREQQVLEAAIRVSIHQEDDKVETQRRVQLENIAVRQARLALERDRLLAQSACSQAFTKADTEVASLQQQIIEAKGRIVQFNTEKDRAEKMLSICQKEYEPHKKNLEDLDNKIAELRRKIEGYEDTFNRSLEVVSNAVARVGIGMELANMPAVTLSINPSTESDDFDEKLALALKCQELRKKKVELDKEHTQLQKQKTDALAEMRVQENVLLAEHQLILNSTSELRKAIEKTTRMKNKAQDDHALETDALKSLEFKITTVKTALSTAINPHALFALKNRESREVFFKAISFAKDNDVVEIPALSNEGVLKLFAKKQFEKLMQTVCLKTQELVLKAVSANPVIDERVKKELASHRKNDNRTGKHGATEKDLVLRKYITAQEAYKGFESLRSQFDFSAARMAEKEKLFQEIVIRFKVYNCYMGLENGSIARPIRPVETAPSSSAAAAAP